MSSYSELFKKGLEGDYGQSFFSYNNYNSLYTFGGVKDDRVGSLSELTQTLIDNPTLSGIYTKIQDLIKESRLSVFEIKKDGSLKKTLPARIYEQELIKNGIEKDIDSFLVARYGGGFGNALAYKIRNGKNIELKFEPFVVNGFHRVEVVGDQNWQNLEVLKYRILNANGLMVYEFNPKQVYHYSYLNMIGNPAFGHNPILTLAKYLRLFSNIFKSQDAIFSGGMQASKFFGIDIEALIKQGTNPENIALATERLKEDLRQANGIINRNRAIVLNYPLKDYNIQMNNSEMRVPEIIPLLTQLFFNAFGVDPSILDISQSKYDNAEKAKDALYQQIRPFLLDIEKYVERWKLPNIDPKFDPSRFVFRIERQFSEEEIRIKELVGKQTAQYFQNLKTANEAFGDINLKFLPTENKLKWLEENDITVKTVGKEEINIKPSTENQTADSFTQLTEQESVYRELTSDQIDEVYSKYHDIVNMSASELEAWAENECSKNASLDRSPIERNLKLLRTPKSEWGQNEVTQANRTISFVSRMKGAEQGEPTKTSDGRSCPSKRDISLKNWAYDPNKNQRNFYDLIKIKIDKSFKSVLENAN